MGKIKIERAIKSIRIIVGCESKIKKELSIINNYFVFKGFQEYGHEPLVNLCSGYELAIICNGYELDISDENNINDDSSTFFSSHFSN